MHLLVVCLLLAAAHGQSTGPHTFFSVTAPFPGVANIRTNFAGSCASILTEPPHGPSDVIIYGFDMKPHYSAEKRQRYYNQLNMTFAMMRLNAPRATVVLFAIEDIPAPLVEIYRRHNITVVAIPQYVGWQNSNARIPAAFKYLTENRGWIRRVIFADSRDVFFLTDPFRIVKPDALMMTHECFQRDHCTNLNHQPLHYQWFSYVFGADEANRYKRMNVPMVNSGVIMGGVRPVLALFRALDQRVKPKFANFWGYEQSLINYVVYGGHLAGVALDMHRCDQAMCITKNGIDFGPQGSQMVLVDTGCSPVVTHQGLPPSWGFVRD